MSESSLREFIVKVIEDDEIRKRIASGIEDPLKIGKSLGYEFTADEIKKFCELLDDNSDNTELNLNKLKEVAGGRKVNTNADLMRNIINKSIKLKSSSSSLRLLGDSDRPLIGDSDRP